MKCVLNKKNLNCIRLLEHIKNRNKGNKILRVFRNPIRIFKSKFFKFISNLFQRTFQLQGKTFWGEKMNLIIPECVSTSILTYGFFEEGLTTIILRYLKNGDTFFDIGAHFGYYTLLASYIVGNNAKVYSFEPTPNTYEILKSNVERKSNVVLNNCALYSKEIMLKFNDYGHAYSAFNSFSIYRARLREEILKKLDPININVKTIAIDKYIENTKCEPDFIKIDAENSELEILKGAKDTIERYHPIITVEVGDYGINDKHSSECISLLNNYGYQAYEYRNNRILKHNIKNEYTYDNILFLYQK